MRYISSARDPRFFPVHAEIHAETAICEEGRAGRYISSVCIATH